MNFSAIGEPMNLAARLEGYCNEYGVSFIVAESTVREALAVSSPREDVRRLLESNEFVQIGTAKPKGFPEEVAFLSARRKI